MQWNFYKSFLKKISINYSKKNGDYYELIAPVHFKEEILEVGN